MTCWPAAVCALACCWALLRHLHVLACILSACRRLEHCSGRVRVPPSSFTHSPPQDWAPEYRPHSIVPPTTIKGDRLRKTFMVSAPMIFKVGPRPCGCWDGGGRPCRGGRRHWWFPWTR